MTYNVHSCIGMDGKLAPERIARVIARCAPDIVALQELDVGRARTAGADQAHLIAHYLEMDFHFHPALLGPEWLAHPDCRGPVIVCGDFNALPASPVCRRLRNRLNDAQIEMERHRPRGTFFGRFPAVRIDHMFVDAGFEVVDIEVPDSELARVASDHLPLIVEIKVDRTAHF
ncbi:MAG: endonuclease/exonuclease/phosphatase family protein [Pseudomonadota bacterium]